jgi:outer membrane receptor for ferrienterochelin and colicin
VWAGRAQSVWRLATDWTVRGSIPVGARFPSSVQTDPGTHSASYRTGSGSYPRVKRLGRGVDHPPPSSAEVKERIELYISPSGLSCSVIGELYFYLYLCGM